MLDAARVHAANAVHEGLTIATLLPESPVAVGQMLATVKIIPYAVPAAALEQVLRACAAMRPRQVARVARGRMATARDVGLVLTRTTGNARIRCWPRCASPLLKRLEPLGAHAASASRSSRTTSRWRWPTAAAPAWRSRAVPPHCCWFRASRQRWIGAMWCPRP